MLKRMMIALGLLLGSMALPAAAQQAWLQVEAQSSEASALRVARDYARRIGSVESYAQTGSRWYAIVVGPFDTAEIPALRRRLRAEGQIPADSFVTDGARFAERLFPDAGSPETAVQETAAPPPDVEPEPQPAPDETVAEARRSEAELDGEERRQLQVALRWAGVYDAGIDGAFGRGTRQAMSAWQDARGFDSTGVLTTLQRAALLAEYNAVLDGLGLQAVSDETAGITVKIPTELVSFDRYEPPFAHYTPQDGADIAARVLLISQRGQRADLYGLYDIMQTLEIVPAEGEREKRPDGFTLVGRNDEIVSHTEARLDGGQVKGFTLIWPAGDEARRTRVVQEMLTSFATTPGRVMDDQVGEPGEDQSIDLLAGLRIRKPAVTRSGFFVSRRGDVLTTFDAVQDCARITLDDDTEAELAATNEAGGLALLRPVQTLSPRQHARFLGRVPRLNSEVILSGYSYDGQLGAPSLTYGSLAAMDGLDGNDRVRRYALSVRPGDAGGPVFDAAGHVMGMLASQPASDRALPSGVAFAADVETVGAFLNEAGVEPLTADSGSPLPRGLIERRASDMTVLVGCWK